MAEKEIGKSFLEASYWGFAGLIGKTVSRDLIFTPLANALSQNPTYGNPLFDSGPNFIQAIGYAMCIDEIISNFTKSRIQQTLATIGIMAAGILATEIAKPLLMNQPIMPTDILAEAGGLLVALIAARVVQA